MLQKKLNVFVARFTEALSKSASKCLLVTLLWFILVFNLWFQFYFNINSEKPRGDETISTMYTRIDSMYVYLGELGSKTFSGVTCQMTQTITFDSTLFSVWIEKHVQAISPLSRTDCVNMPRFTQLKIIELFDETTKTLRYKRITAVSDPCDCKLFCAIFFSNFVRRLFWRSTIANRLEWLWNPPDSFVICFCGPDGAQRSTAIPVCWSYWPIKTSH